MASSKVPAALLFCEIRGLVAHAQTAGVAGVEPVLEALLPAVVDSIGRAGGRFITSDGDLFVFGFGGSEAHPAPGRHACSAAAYLLRKLKDDVLSSRELETRTVALGVKGKPAGTAGLGWNAAKTKALVQKALAAAEPNQALLSADLKGDLPPGLPSATQRSVGPSRYLAVSAGGGAPPASAARETLAAELAAGLDDWRVQGAAREKLPIAVVVAQATASGGVAKLRKAAERLAKSDKHFDVRNASGGVAVFCGLDGRVADSPARIVRFGIALRAAAAEAAPRAGVATTVVAASVLAKSSSERKPPLSSLVGKAAGLATKSAPGELRVPEAIMAELGDRFRGVAAAASTIAVTDLAPAGWRADWSAAGVPGGAFVGRRSELRYAEEGLNELARKGARYLVLGEPGAGKSALLARWRYIAESKGARVGFGSCRPDLPRMPFCGFREAIADLFNLPLRHTAAQAADAVAARFSSLELDPSSPRAAAIVSFLVGYSDTTLDRLSAEVRTKLLRAAIREWFAAEGEHHPVAIMMDDAQHADPVQRALLPKLVIACKPLPVLWVLAGRSGDNQPVMPEVRRIRLGGMTPTDLRETLRRGLGGVTPDPALLKWCGAAGGLPGVAVDRLREVAAGGELMPELIVPEPPEPEESELDIDGGDLDAVADALLAQAETAPAKQPPLKPELPNPIAARRAALSEASEQVLSAAAILGPRTTHEELSAVLGRDASRGMSELLAAGILVERALSPTPTYEFASHYLWEACSGEADAEQVQQAHRSVFKLLSKRSEGDAGYLESLVAHGRAAGEAGQVEAQVVAGVTAAHEHNLEAAESHLREALAQLGEGAKQRPIVRFHLAEVLGRRGALDEALEHLSRALEELPQTRVKAVRRVVSKRR